MKNSLNMKCFQIISTKRELKAKHLELIAMEEEFWWGKPWENWLATGNKNTKFFHASVRARRERNKIKEITFPIGEICFDLMEAANFFQTLLNYKDKMNDPMQEDILSLVPRYVDDSDNKILLEPFSLE